MTKLNYNNGQQSQQFSMNSPNKYLPSCMAVVSLSSIVSEFIVALLHHLGSPVSYWASHQFDAERRSLFFSVPHLIPQTQAADSRSKQGHVYNDKLPRELI